MIVSGVLWLGCGVVALGAGPRAAGNPFGALARESAFMMVVCIPLAFAATMVRVEWFFPAMMVLVGAHYLPFATLYGMRLYWALGAAMVGAGFLLALGGAGVATGAFVGGAIELLFVPLAWFAVRREPLPAGSTLSI